MNRVDITARAHPRADGSALLELKSITKRFNGLTAVNELSFDVRAGEILALMGPNGAGKTTTFNLIAGRLKPTSGAIIFDGCDVTRKRADQRCSVGIARTFQITQPFQSLSVLENVMVGGILTGRSLRETRSAVADYIELVGLSQKTNSLAGTLSTGQRKRLELARAIATRPKLLLMDEVTGGVDQKSIPGIIELVHRLRDSGVTVVLIEHNMKVISELADRAVFVNRGTLIAAGSPKEVGVHPEVVELYLGKRLEE